MRYIGIDQSLSSTGVTVLKEGEEPSFFRIVPPKEFSVGVKRLSYITDEIRKIVSKIDDDLIIAREDYAYAGKGFAFSLGELGGCIDMKLYESINKNSRWRVKYFSIPSNTWKLLILGNGAVKKDTKYLLTVFNKTGKSFTSDDVADSYMICLAIKKMHWFDFDKLTDKEKFGMISSHIRKKSKITEATIKKLIDSSIFKNYVNQTLEEFLVFTGGKNA